MEDARETLAVRHGGLAAEQGPVRREEWRAAGLLKGEIARWVGMAEAQTGGGGHAMALWLPLCKKWLSHCAVWLPSFD